MTPSEARSGQVKAWACLATNALVLPGLGSIVAGRWLAGTLQALGSLAGFAMTMYWSYSWLRTAVTEDSLPTGLGPLFRYGLAGLLLFGAAWLWGLVTGLQLVRDARGVRS